MLEVFIIATIFIALAFVGLGVNIFFRNRAFPETEVGKNSEMKALGLSCARCQEMKEFREKRQFENMRIDFTKLQHS